MRKTRLESNKKSNQQSNRFSYRVQTEIVEPQSKTKLVVSKDVRATNYITKEYERMSSPLVDPLQKMHGVCTPDSQLNPQNNLYLREVKEKFDKDILIQEKYDSEPERNLDLEQIEKNNIILEKFDMESQDSELAMSNQKQIEIVQKKKTVLIDADVALEKQKKGNFYPNSTLKTDNFYSKTLFNKNQASHTDEKKKTATRSTSYSLDRKTKNTKDTFATTHNNQQQHITKR